MILTLLIFSVLNIALAFIDAHKIIKGKWIKHGVNGAVYLAMLVLPYLLFQNWLFLGVLLLNRLLVFNIFLSLFRGLNWDYVTPGNPPKSLIDRWAKSIFGMNGKLMYGTYAVVFAILLILTYMV